MANTILTYPRLGLLASTTGFGFVHVCWGELSISSLNHSILEINYNCLRKDQTWRWVEYVFDGTANTQKTPPPPPPPFFYLIFISKRRSRINFPVSYKQPGNGYLNIKSDLKGALIWIFKNEYLVEHSFLLIVVYIFKFHFKMFIFFFPFNEFIIKNANYYLICCHCTVFSKDGKSTSKNCFINFDISTERPKKPRPFSLVTP